MRVGDPTDEQDLRGLQVPNDGYERSVYLEFQRLFARCDAPRQDDFEHGHRRRFGPIFVDLQLGDMGCVPDVEPLLPRFGHRRQIGLVSRKGQGEPQAFERIDQLAVEIDLEPRQPKVDGPQAAFIQKGAQCLQLHRRRGHFHHPSFARHYYVHREPVPAIGQADRTPAVPFRHRERFGLGHQAKVLLAAVAEQEGRCFRPVEHQGPLGFEIERIGQHGSGIVSERVRRDDRVDQAGGLLGRPAVDLRCGPGWVARKVQCPCGRGIALARFIEISGTEPESVRQPQCVGEPQVGIGVMVQQLLSLAF